jgi:hypothetical protein
MSIVSNLTTHHTNKLNAILYSWLLTCVMLYDRIYILHEIHKFHPKIKCTENQ